MKPITVAEIEGVREALNSGEDVKFLDGSEAMRDTLDAIVGPALNSLPPVHACDSVFIELVAVLTMGIGIGASVIEERALGEEGRVALKIAAGLREAQDRWRDPGMSLEAKAAGFDNAAALAAAFIEREFGGK